LRPTPSVSTLTVVDGVPIDRLADAWAVTLPGVGEVKTMMH
jgi:hypothetical protein